jgi:CBS-domain-containing membrane protein
MTIFSDKLMTNLQLIISQKDIRRLPIVDNKGQMVGFADVFRVLWMANRWKQGK